jgi:hypothetical protein
MKVERCLMVTQSLTAFSLLRQVNGHESSAFYVVFLLLLTKFCGASSQKKKICGANPSIGSRAIWTSERPNREKKILRC